MTDFNSEQVFFLLFTVTTNPPPLSYQTGLSMLKVECDSCCATALLLVLLLLAPLLHRVDACSSSHSLSIDFSKSQASGEGGYVM